MEVAKLLINAVVIIATGWFSYKTALAKTRQSLMKHDEELRNYVDREIEDKAGFGPLYVMCPTCHTKIMLTKENIREEKF